MMKKYSEKKKKIEKHLQVILFLITLHAISEIYAKERFIHYPFAIPVHR